MYSDVITGQRTDQEDLDFSDHVLCNLGAPCPEERFMRALLEDAIACLRGINELPPLTKRRLSRSAKHWFMSDDTRHPLAFRNVCHALALDPGCVRAHLNLQQALRLQSVPLFARSPAD